MDGRDLDIVDGYLCGFVFGGGDAVGSIKGPLKIGHRHTVFVGLDVIE